MSLACFNHHSKFRCVVRSANGDLAYLQPNGRGPHSG